MTRVIMSRLQSCIIALLTFLCHFLCSFLFLDTLSCLLGLVSFKVLLLLSKYLYTAPRLGVVVSTQTFAYMCPCTHTVNASDHDLYPVCHREQPQEMWCQDGVDAGVPYCKIHYSATFSAKTRDVIGTCYWWGSATLAQLSCVQKALPTSW